eukprot:scaffold34749_cov84-Isochrysis_galbana.AAC.2
MAPREDGVVSPTTPPPSLAFALPSKRMRTARLLPGRGRRRHLARRKSHTQVIHIPTKTTAPSICTAHSRAPSAQAVAVTAD